MEHALKLAENALYPPEPPLSSHSLVSGSALLSAATPVFHHTAACSHSTGKGKKKKKLESSPTTSAKKAISALKECRRVLRELSSYLLLAGNISKASGFSAHVEGLLKTIQSRLVRVLLMAFSPSSVVSFGRVKEKKWKKQNTKGKSLHPSTPSDHTTSARKEVPQVEGELVSSASLPLSPSSVSSLFSASSFTSSASLDILTLLSDSGGDIPLVFPYRTGSPSTTPSLSGGKSSRSISSASSQGILPILPRGSGKTADHLTDMPVAPTSLVDNSRRRDESESLPQQQQQQQSQILETPSILSSKAPPILLANTSRDAEKGNQYPPPPPSEKEVTVANGSTPTVSSLARVQRSSRDTSPLPSHGKTSPTLAPVLLPRPRTPEEASGGRETTREEHTTILPETRKEEEDEDDVLLTAAPHPIIVRLSASTASSPDTSIRKNAFSATPEKGSDTTVGVQASSSVPHPLWWSHEAHGTSIPSARSGASVEDADDQEYSERMVWEMGSSEEKTSLHPTEEDATQWQNAELFWEQQEGRREARGECGGGIPHDTSMEFLEGHDTLDRRGMAAPTVSPHAKEAMPTDVEAEEERGARDLSFPPSPACPTTDTGENGAEPVGPLLGVRASVSNECLSVDSDAAGAGRRQTTMMFTHPKEEEASTPTHTIMDTPETNGESSKRYAMHTEQEWNELLTKKDHENEALLEQLSAMAGELLRLTDAQEKRSAEKNEKIDTLAAAYASRLEMERERYAFSLEAKLSQQERVLKEEEVQRANRFIHMMEACSRKLFILADQLQVELYSEREEEKQKRRRERLYGKAQWRTDEEDTPQEQEDRSTDDWDGYAMEGEGMTRDAPPLESWERMATGLPPENGNAKKAMEEVCPAASSPSPSTEPLLLLLEEEKEKKEEAMKDRTSLCGSRDVESEADEMQNGRGAKRMHPSAIWADGSLPGISSQPTALSSSPLLSANILLQYKKRVSILLREQEEYQHALAVLKEQLERAEKQLDQRAEVPTNDKGNTMAEYDVPLREELTYHVKRMEELAIVQKNVERYSKSSDMEDRDDDGEAMDGRGSEKEERRKRLVRIVEKRTPSRQRNTETENKRKKVLPTDAVNEKETDEKAVDVVHAGSPAALPPTTALVVPHNSNDLLPVSRSEGDDVYSNDFSGRFPSSCVSSSPLYTTVNDGTGTGSFVFSSSPLQSPAEAEGMIALETLFDCLVGQEVEVHQALQEWIDWDSGCPTCTVKDGDRESKEKKRQTDGTSKEHLLDVWNVNEWKSVSSLLSSAAVLDDVGEDMGRLVKDLAMNSHSNDPIIGKKMMVIMRILLCQGFTMTKYLYEQHCRVHAELVQQVNLQLVVLRKLMLFLFPTPPRRQQQDDDTKTFSPKEASCSTSYEGEGGKKRKGSGRKERKETSTPHTIPVCASRQGPSSGTSKGPLSPRSIATDYKNVTISKLEDGLTLFPIIFTSCGQLIWEMVQSAEPLLAPNGSLTYLRQENV